jgi:hypothetical protein
MMTITTREIAKLTPAEQRKMQRWIGEDSHLSELSGSRRGKRRSIDEEESWDDNVPDFAE